MPRGVTWILAVAWWTYQAANFVTPPNAGYVSAPAAFSRAAAETVTLLTGDEFFPGGLGEFRAEADEFLQLENGPSVDVNLQWATYRDAADQASLATFWAGIQSPIDDIPGRLIGRRVGIDAFHRAGELFSGSQTAVEERGQAAQPGALALEQNFPNPFNSGTVIRFDLDRPGEIELSLYDLAGRKVATLARGPRPAGRYEVRWDGRGPAGSRLASGVYLYRLQSGERSQRAASCCCCAEVRSIATLGGRDVSPGVVRRMQAGGCILHVRGGQLREVPVRKARPDRRRITAPDAAPGRWISLRRLTSLVREQAGPRSGCTEYTASEIPAERRSG